MAESSLSTTYAKVSWLQAWRIRDETYPTAQAEVVNSQFRQAFAATPYALIANACALVAVPEHRPRQPEVR